MIVQGSPAGQPSFVMTMDQHTAFAGELARAFGNARFEPVAPRDEMLYVIDHHDAGWRALDAEAPRNPETGLPFHLVETPFARIVKTSSASPDFNSERHPFCGLLSSMHSWGLYNGRYGMSDKVLLEGLAGEKRSVAEGMLRHEESRQEALRGALAKDPKTAPWIEEDHLFQNYKQLQFFDTLALYFNCTPEAERGEDVFAHVPLDAKQDVGVSVRPGADGTYAFSPFPFLESGIEVSFQGRYLEARGTGETLGTLLAKQPIATQSLRLVEG